MKKIIVLLAFCLIACINAQSQKTEPVKWNTQINNTEKENFKEIVFSAHILGEWHLFGTQLPEGGPHSTAFVFDKIEGAVLLGNIREIDRPIEEYNSLFEMNLKWYNHSARFIQGIEIIPESEKVLIEGHIEYQACNNVTCLPPTRHNFVLEETINKIIPNAEPSISSTISTQHGHSNKAYLNTWKPVKQQMEAFGENHAGTEISYRKAYVNGFKGGLLSLLTPCLWPMILMSIYSFQQQRSSRKQSIFRTLLYSVTLLIVFPLCGILLTSAFGIQIFYQFTTNLISNLFLFILFVILAAFLLGAFHSSIISKKKAVGNFIGLSILTVLLSLSCTGSYIGSYLTQAASLHSILGPYLTLTGFVSAFVLPVAIILIFITWNPATPKQAHRLLLLNRITGFFILAYSLTFLSIADLIYGKHLLNREIFLVLWIIIFSFLGIYLIGKLKFTHDKETPSISVGRFFLAILTFSFTLYMVPGLLGAPLKEIGALVPPLYAQDFNLYTKDFGNHFDNYNEGMEYAKNSEKPVLLEFSGYGCAESRKMEASVWTYPRIKHLLNQEFVVIRLMVDDKTKLPKAEIISIDGKPTKITTFGEKWQALQQIKFGSESQPYQVILTPKGDPLSSAYGYSIDIKQYINFLNNGLNRFKQQLK